MVEKSEKVKVVVEVAGGAEVTPATLLGPVVAEDAAPVAAPVAEDTAPDAGGAAWRA